MVHSHCRYCVVITQVTLSKRQLQNMAEIPLAALRNIAKKRLGELFSEEINCGTLYSNKILIRCQFYKDGRCDKQFVGYNNTQLLQSIIDSHISGHISYIVETGKLLISIELMC